MISSLDDEGERIVKNPCDGPRARRAGIEVMVVGVLSALLASPAPGQGTGPEPRLPGAVTRAPSWLNRAPFDLAAFFEMPPPAQNAAPLKMRRGDRRFQATGESPPSDFEKVRRIWTPGMFPGALERRPGIKSLRPGEPQAVIARPEPGVAGDRPDGSPDRRRTVVRRIGSRPPASRLAGPDGASGA